MIVWRTRCRQAGVALYSQLQTGELKLPSGLLAWPSQAAGLSTCFHSTPLSSLQFIRAHFTPHFSLDRPRASLADCGKGEGVGWQAAASAQLLRTRVRRPPAHACNTPQTAPASASLPPMLARRATRQQRCMPPPHLHVFFGGLRGSRGRLLHARHHTLPRRAPLLQAQAGGMRSLGAHYASENWRCWQEVACSACARAAKGLAAARGAARQRGAAKRPAGSAAQPGCWLHRVLQAAPPTWCASSSCRRCSSSWKSWPSGRSPPEPLSGTAGAGAGGRRVGGIRGMPAWVHRQQPRRSRL